MQHSINITASIFNYHLLINVAIKPFEYMHFLKTSTFGLDRQFIDSFIDNILIK